MKKWFLVPLFLLLAVSMIFTGCQATPETVTTTETETETETDTQIPEPYGSLTDVAASFGNDSFDPNLVTSWGLIYQYIVRTTEDMNFEGDVLSGWDISEDGNTWTFHLIPNNHFTNGDAVTAADVKYSIEHFAGPTSRSPWSPYLREAYNFVSMTVIDDVTLEYVTAHPESTLLPVFSAVAILDKTEVDRIGEEAYFQNPVGSGPWKYVGRVTDVSIKFEANTEYCRASEVPHFQYYTQYLVPELATRISMFKTGQCDFLLLDDYARMKELQNEGYPIVNYGIAGTDSFAFQWSWLPEAGPVNDINIRKAMSYALDRQEICDTWYQGYAIPGGQFIMCHGIFGWTDELVPDAYNTTLAEQLIADAGYPGAFADPVITIFCQAPDQDRMLLYMGYWEAVGLQVELRVMETATYWAYLGFGPPQTDNVGWIWFWKSFGYPNSTYHSANMYTSTGVHKTANDPTADAMYVEITHQKDYATAWTKMQEFQVYVKSLYINIGVVEYASYALYNPATVGGFSGRLWEGYGPVIRGATHPTT